MFHSIDRIDDRPSRDHNIDMKDIDIVKVKNLVQTGIRETTLGLGESSSICRSDPVCTETVVKQATFELQSRLDRKNNIVCYNVTEHDSNLKDDCVRKQIEMQGGRNTQAVDTVKEGEVETG